MICRRLATLFWWLSFYLSHGLCGRNLHADTAAFEGCVRRVCKGGAIVDVIFCVKCPMKKNGCAHKCPGYHYGTIGIVFRERA
jgi:hypothetical protein